MKNNFFLVPIVIIAIFLRFNNLNSVPPSASLDEASIGYNAYSILKTGADEYSTRFPILLRAYDDWRPALYVYLVIPFVKLFGLSVASVRLPSVILSVFTVIATYFFAKEIFTNDKNKIIIARVSALLLAISPWHIYISRLGHEVNAGLSFAIFAILFLLKAINNKRSLFLITSSVFFGFSLYTYQSEKIFIPLIIIVLGFVYRNNLLAMKRKLLVSFILGMVIIVPIILATLSPQGLIRFKGTSAFIQESFYKESAEKVLKYKHEENLLGEIANNRRLVPLKIFTLNYFSHFNPKFLFFNSGNESFKAPNFGLFYFWEFPILIIGVILLFVRYSAVKMLFGSWVLIAFVAPSLTTGAPHAMRALNILPAPQIIAALGIVWIINFIRKRNYKIPLNVFYLFMAVIAVYSLVNFYKEYFYSFPKNQSASFQYSLSSAIKFVLGNEKSYAKIVFSNKDNLYQSYMFYLFYSKYDPFLYQKQGGSVSGGFEETHKFGKYEFRPIIWNKDKLLGNTLFVGNASDFPGERDSQNFFSNIDGKGLIQVVNKMR